MECKDSKATASADGLMGLIENIVECKVFHPPFRALLPERLIENIVECKVRWRTTVRQLRQGLIENIVECKDNRKRVRIHITGGLIENIVECKVVDNLIDNPVFLGLIEIIVEYFQVSMQAYISSSTLAPPPPTMLYLTSDRRAPFHEHRENDEGKAGGKPAAGDHPGVRGTV